MGIKIPQNTCCPKFSLAFEYENNEKLYEALKSTFRIHCGSSFVRIWFLDKVYTRKTINQELEGLFPIHLLNPFPNAYHQNESDQTSLTVYNPSI